MGILEERVDLRQDSDCCYPLAKGIVMQRYIGRVVTLDAFKHCGFISLASIVKEDDSAHDLATTQDVFVHQDDCGSALKQGMQLAFEVVPDQRRGGNALRAVDVNEYVVGELVLVGESSGASRELTDPRSLYVPPTPAQRGLMKPVAPEEVEQVLINRPMPLVPRTSGECTESAAEITRHLMQRLFPQFAALSDEEGVEMADEKFDAVIKQAIDDHKELGMENQATHMLGQAKTYKGLRMILRSEEDLLRPETLIPMQYLPDLFMAVPVWYFWADNSTQRDAATLKSERDPQVHKKLKYFCDQIPNQRWVDTFLMFNRRMRTLPDYKGDLIPPRIIARMRKMAGLFDHLVIMTPYHDVAGQDWQDLQWLRSIDPYVVGFTNGVPLMFVLGRFSDSGTFPLYSELVADTIAFLRANVDKLKGFNGPEREPINNPYWHFVPGTNKNSNSCFMGPLGNHLVSHTKQLLTAFDNGNLFDWLRGEDGNLPMRT
ncbi:hypothetical protein A3A40_01865 [Candidatus Kaiserbacteria bacterium RIFCSPLOWO2_01_FULL_54_20]|uniref:Uncharacterized protein n=1 Tax=Candidatus Kaiserbacteria bacterium RIFCSPLOWO2_01_FULL_54_20 TaxID=1798513 RepID=A0A1F6EIJ6_9BACT|nr:MAG: hypothetical protein A3A40_01865 [Candidatus Kaiserbacteria bacterium RIFCSPLOWO2_01_FULL_54_20]